MNQPTLAERNFPKLPLIHDGHADGGGTPRSRGDTLLAGTRVPERT
jgi:hypothetical protein